MKTLSKTILATALLTMVGAANAAVTGNIGVVSQYINRGATAAPESDIPAVQGGLDYSHESGFYAGYWGSTLHYKGADVAVGLTGDGAGNITGVAAVPTDKAGFENDFYAGYNGKVGEVGYTVGATYFYYNNIDDSDAAETKLGVSYGPVSLTAQTLLKDVAWGNKGDTYWLVKGSQALPSDFTASAELGYYTYKKDETNVPTTESSNFRHATVGISHPLAASGATMGLSYVLGGKDRNDADLDEAVVASVGMTF